MIVLDANKPLGMTCLVIAKPVDCPVRELASGMMHV